MEYVAIARHSVDSCPGASAKVSEVLQEVTPKLQELGQKHRVSIRSSHILSPAHISILIIDAPTVEAVRDFLEEGRFTQWNDVEVHPSIEYAGADGEGYPVSNLVGSPKALGVPGHTRV